MAIHRIYRRQFLPASPEAVWKFFSGAGNLQAITPEYMRFRVTSGELPQQIYPGQLITYTVSPLLRIPLFWMTEITHVVEGKLFVDEQRRGPYRLWHHQHHFEEGDGGVWMTDIVHYQLPFGPLGDLARLLFVDRQVGSIFDFREKKVAALFGGPQTKSDHHEPLQHQRS